MTAVRELESLYPGRRFTMDGHLVGSIGEVLAAELYGLTLLPASSRCHDGVCPTGRNVQIKLTQRSQVAMYEEPDYLIALRIDSEGRIEEVYNGPGERPWAAAGKMQKNGQRAVSISQLRRLSSAVLAQDRIARITSPRWFDVKP
jgi:hypothetical protein